MGASCSHIQVIRVGEPIPQVKLDSPDVIAAYYRQHISSGPQFDPEKEHLHVLALNTQLNIKGINLVSVGSLNEAVAHPREVFRPLIALAAYGFILVHNHPSGDASPSDADRRLTMRIREAGHLLQIELVDHVIIGEHRFSFREAGLI